MNTKEFERRLALQKQKLEQKAKRLAELTKGEKDNVSINLLNSLIAIRREQANAATVILKMLPTKSILDAFSEAQLANIDFIVTAATEMINVIEFCKKNKK